MTDHHRKKRWVGELKYWLVLAVIFSVTLFALASEIGRGFAWIRWGFGG